MEALKLNTGQQRYTYADYAKWETAERYELIDGAPFMMASPKKSHQRLVGNIYLQLGNFLSGRTCEPFLSPYDVCLFGKGDGDGTVVQPDVFVVCDPSKAAEDYVNGAPDFIVEVLSPSTASTDLVFKLNKYQQAGVREYWVVEPQEKSVHVFILKNGKFDMTLYEKATVIPVSVLEGCEITISNE